MVLWLEVRTGTTNTNCTWRVSFNHYEWNYDYYEVRWAKFVVLTVRQLNSKIADFNKTGRFSLWYSETDLPGVLHNIGVKELLEHNVVFKFPVSLAFYLQSDIPHLADNLIFRVLGPKKGDIYRNRNLPVVSVSENAGVVMSPNFNGVKSDPGYPHNYDGHFKLNVLANQSVFISFVSSYLRENTFHAEGDTKKSKQFCYEQIFLSALGNKIYCDCFSYCQDHLIFTVGLKEVWREKSNAPPPQPRVYLESISVTFSADYLISSLGFKMMYAILSRQQEPQEVSPGVFNCSVPHFEAFAPVLRCNMAVECVGGEDERDCEFPYESQECGPGLFDVGEKCYRVVHTHTEITWSAAYAECSKHKEMLVTTATPEDEEIFMRVIAAKKDSKCVFIGLRRLGREHLDSLHPPVALMYRHLWRWTDGRTAFFLKMNSYYYTHLTLCAMFKPGFGTYLDYLPLHPIWCNLNYEYDNCDFICEKTKLNDRSNIYHENNSSASEGSSDDVWNVTVVPCPAGHVVRDFLSCDPESQCGAEEYMTSCDRETMKVPMFMCELSKTSVHYSLVCDYIQHCSDNSDEKFCHFDECFSLECQNGQCISIGQECNRKVNCADFSDERFCSIGEGYKFEILIPNKRPPFIADIDTIGNYTLINLKNSHYCPSTHFFCPEGICLPRHLRCNDIVDCPGREDEAGCETYTCPGLYRCWGSQVCLYPHQVCDGQIHCPQQDDEMLCDLDPCPDVCQCQGLAFVCSQSFNARFYSNIRLLGASGSNMTLENIGRNKLLIYADLSRCGINKLQQATSMLNLRHLDLSWNQLLSVDLSQFVHLENLRVLILSGNPVSSISMAGESSSKAMTVHVLDLSHSLFPVYNGSTFAACSSLKVLNLSWSHVAAISDGGFQTTPLLEIIDIKNSPLTFFPDDVLRNLTDLEAVYTDNFKLCCPAILPDNFLLQNCHSSEDLLSSCEDLFGVRLHRIFVWVCAALAIVGNVGTFVARICKSDSDLDSFGVFVNCLTLADFVMGVYLAIIGIADSTFHGQYLFYDLLWKNSTTCRTAGFLFLLSSEVSAFNICLIMLDRALVMRYPSSKVHFDRVSALVLCTVIWTVGVALALIPLLPASSHWQYFSQTSICIPLLFKMNEDFQGYNYTFSIMVVLNFTLYLIIACGEVLTSWSYFSLSNKDNASLTRSATIARRFTSIVVSDILCWFPIGLLGLLSYTGTHITDNLSLAMTIFVLPVNSALNPFLYTYSVVMEKQRKARREMLIAKLRVQLVRK